jgi:predicted secreted protein
MGIIGHGTTVKLGASNVIAKVVRVSISGSVRDDIDITNADSTDLIKEQLGGMVTPGKATFTVRYDATSAGYLETHFADGSSEVCLVTLSDTHTIQATGFVSGLDAAEVSYDGDVTQSFTFTATTLWNYT